MQQVGDVARLRDPGRVGEEVPDARGPEATPRGEQPVGVEVVVRGRVEVDDALLVELHHGDRREGLGDRADPEHRVFIDRRAGRDLSEPASVEEVERS
jgi:hypothetical protein